MNIKGIGRKIKESLRIIKENRKVLAIGIFAELLFFSLCILFTNIFSIGILGNLEQLGGKIITSSPETGSSLSNIVMGSEYFRSIVILGVIIAAIVYLLYCAFQGFIWRFCFNFFEKKGKYIPYIKKFFLVNLFWYPFFIAYVLLDFFFYYADTVGQRIDPTGNFFLSNITTIILMIILYFTFISYVQIEKYGIWKSIKESFRIGIKKAVWVMIMYLIILIVFLAVNYLLIPIGGLHYILVILLGTLVIMPLMLWARVFIKSVVNEL